MESSSPSLNRKRVGVVALLQESNTFIDGVTVRRHFEEDLLVSGEAVRERLGGAPHEVGGFFQGLEEAGVEAVPVFAARAYPYGVIEAEVFDALVEEMLEGLRQAGPLDGVLAAPHGATVAANQADADGWWLSQVREVIGPEVPLIATIDPHANLSEAMVAATDALLAYRSNPHLDQRETGLRAARLMARTLSGEVRPVQAAVFPPMAINIQSQSTSSEPLRELYAAAEAAETGAPGEVLAVSVVLGFPYADVAEMGSAVVVVADGTVGLAGEVAGELGRRMWEMREAFEPEFLSPHRAVSEALAGVRRTLLLDMGDNVGGGSPGNGTVLLQELDRQGAGSAFVCLYDPEGVAQAAALGEGGFGEMRLVVAGDALHGGPVTLECEVVGFYEGQFSETAVRHGGFQSFDMGRCAVVRTQRGLTVLLTSRRVPPFSLEQLRCCGLEPTDFQVLVAKGVIAPLAAYGPVVDKVLFVNTPGVTCADMTRLPFHQRRRPMFPFEREAGWVWGEGV